MTRRPDDRKSDPPGGRAAERLREFIDQRFPGGMPISPSTTGEGDPTDEHLNRLEQTLLDLVEAQQHIESRIDQLEKTLQKLVEAQKRTEK